MSRRKFLRLAGVGIVAGVSGCSALPGVGGNETNETGDQKTDDSSGYDIAEPPEVTWDEHKLGGRSFSVFATVQFKEQMTVVAKQSGNKIKEIQGDAGDKVHVKIAGQETKHGPIELGKTINLHVEGEEVAFSFWTVGMNQEPDSD